MTIVLAVIDDDGALVFGADSAASSDVYLTRRSDAKVFQKRGYTIGFAGSFRFYQIVHYEMCLPTLPAHLTAASALRFMVQKFIPALRACHTAHGNMKTDNGVESCDGSTILVGIHSFLFTVEDDFHIAPHSEYVAIGSGAEIAMGSLFSSKHIGTFAEDAVRVALDAAEFSCVSVRGPMHVIRA